jgi:hypothetical protein
LLLCLVAEATPKFETTRGVRYANVAFSQTTEVALPATMTGSWFIAKKADPTMSATVTVLFRC